MKIALIYTNISSAIRSAVTVGIIRSAAIIISYLRRLSPAGIGTDTIVIWRCAYITIWLHSRSSCSPIIIVGLPVPEGFVLVMPEFLPGSAVPMPLLLFPEPRTGFVAASIEPLFEVALGLTFTLVFPIVGLGSEVLILPTTVGDSLAANLPPVRP